MANYTDLKYFCTLVDCGSYTLAAQQLIVTQPTISTAVKRLAREYNDPLVTQKNRKSSLHLTSTGKLLYQKGQYLLKEIDAFDRDIKHSSERKIRIAFSGEAGGVYMPPIVHKFYQAGILSLLEEHYERSAASFKNLETGKIDVAIYSWNFPINDPNYFIHTLDKTELVIIAHPNHPLAKYDSVSAKDLAQERFIARSPGYLTRESLDILGHKGNFTPNIIYTSKTMELMIDLVRENMGIAFVMDSSLKSNHNLKVIHLKNTEKMYAYMQIAMRKSFVPTQYQQRGIEILRNFKGHLLSR